MKQVKEYRQLISWNELQTITTYHWIILQDVATRNKICVSDGLEVFPHRLCASRNASRFPYSARAEQPNRQTKNFVFCFIGVFYSICLTGEAVPVPRPTILSTIKITVRGGAPPCRLWHKLKKEKADKQKARYLYCAVVIPYAPLISYRAR